MKVALTAPFLALLSSISVSVAAPTIDTSVVDKHSAPLLSSTTAEGSEVPNNYIVVFKKNVDSSKASAHQSWVADVHSSSIAALKKRSQIPLAKSLMGDYDIDSLVGIKHTYNISDKLAGYSGAFDESTLDAIRKHPDVSLTRHAKLSELSAAFKPRHVTSHLSR